MKCVSVRNQTTFEKRLPNEYIMNNYRSDQSATQDGFPNHLLEWSVKQNGETVPTGSRLKSELLASAQQMRSERSPGSSPDVHQLPAQLYYESVQLNMSPVDEVNVALRHDVANWLETTTMKSKKLDAESGQDSEKMEIEEFLRVHCMRIAQGCRDVPVKELRHIIPILILHCFCMKGEQAQKKVKGLWERAPQGWPADVPYCDPNNAPLRSRTGEPVGTKPKKETLNQMFDFLIREYLRQNRDYATTQILDSARLSTAVSHDVSKYSSIVQEDSRLAPTWPSIADSPIKVSRPYWQSQQGAQITPTMNHIPFSQSHFYHPFIESQMSTAKQAIAAQQQQQQQHQQHHQQESRKRPYDSTDGHQQQAEQQQQQQQQQQYRLFDKKNEQVRSPSWLTVGSTEVSSTTSRLAGKKAAIAAYEMSVSSDDTTSHGSRASSFSYSDHMPPLLDCRSLIDNANEAKCDADVPVLVAVKRSPEPAVAPTTCLSPGIPVSSSQPPASPPHPMTKKARLLAAVENKSVIDNHPVSPTRSEASDTSIDDKSNLTPTNDKPLADLMSRITDKISALESQQVSMDKFGIILVIKDLLWKMRPLLDGSQYLAYLEKLHELDCTLDSIRMLGKFPETHYNRWQEFEDKWYIRVCGHTIFDNSDSETVTSFAQK